MGRKQGAFPNIISLKLLMELYFRIKKFPAFSEGGNNIAYNTKLTGLLKSDLKISQSSLNIATKLRGIAVKKTRRFSNNNNQNASLFEGISREHLERLAKIVIEHYKLHGKFKLPSTGSYWDDFEKNILQLQPVIDGIKGHQKYYSQLNLEQQSTVDQFVNRKVDEFAINPKDVKFYSAYFWNNKERKLEGAIITVNMHIRYAVMEYIYLVDGDWKTKTIQRTDKEGGLFKLEQSTLFLHCLEENSEKKHLVTDLALAIHDSEYKHLKFIKGTYLTSRSNGAKPVAGVILLERKSSYQEAYSTLSTPNAIAPQIYFELMQKRLIVDDEKINDFKDFGTHKTYNTFKNIVGLYTFGFLKKKWDDGKLRAITKGICEISGSGDVKLFIGNIRNELQGHIVNTLFYNSKIIRITNYFIDSRDDSFRSKYEYTLEIVTDNDKPSHPVTFLKGIYSGVEKMIAPRCGEILFIKTDKYKTFDEAVKNEIPELGYISMDAQNPSPMDRTLIEYFWIDKIYERNYLIINTQEIIKKKSKA